VPRGAGFAGRQRASRPVASGQPHTYGVGRLPPRRMACSMPARTRSLHLCSWQRKPREGLQVAARPGARGRAKEGSTRPHGTARGSQGGQLDRNG
jgi:hypothetical protein